jgi:LmbE family N-acetylglucosaminyl deacetylase
MRFLIVQPHLDDAFFSLSETALTWVEDGHEVQLLTVFGGVPPVGNERWEKHKVMWEEYERALRAGPFDHSAAGLFLDDAARTDQLMFTEVVDFLKRHISGTDPDLVVWPQGIHHPDHQVVRDAGLYLRNYGGFPQRAIYDELPYFVMYPEDSFAADERVADTAWGRFGHVREGNRSHLSEKQRICRLFASQMGETEERCLWAPERCWRPR